MKTVAHPIWKFQLSISSIKENYPRSFFYSNRESETKRLEGREKAWYLWWHQCCIYQSETVPCMNIITPLNVFYIPHWADSSKYVYVQHVAYTVPLVLYVSLILTQNQHTKPLAYSCHKIQLQGSQNIALDIWPTMLSSRVQRKGTGKHSTDLYLRVGLVAVFRNCSSELKKGGGWKK